MSETSIERHSKQFDGWPTLPTVASAMCPKHDGDISQLDELQERVFVELADLPYPPTDWLVECDDLIYQDMRNNDVGFPYAFGFRYWPDDRAAEQLAYWRYELDKGQIV